MPKEELVRYITDALDKGKQLEEIAANLINAGWNEDDIAAAIDYVLPPELDVPVPTPSQITVPTPQTQTLNPIKNENVIIFGITAHDCVLMYILATYVAGILFSLLWSANPSFILVESFFEPFFGVVVLLVNASVAYVLFKSLRHTQSRLTRLLSIIVATFFLFKALAVAASFMYQIYPW